ncbi:MAG TPA: type II toxin-antitoxin system HicB family antitoxin [Acidimicrobiales bacterium]|jgi:predicted RNase H-like HicB family nuclease
MTEYAVVIEDAGDNFSAYVPDLPGCVSTGATVEEVTANLRAAIALHIASLREHREDVPPALSRASSVQIA